MDEELELFRDNVVRFLEAEMLPTTRRRAERQPSATPCGARPANWACCAWTFPEAYGGGGGDFRHEAVIHEEMARRAPAA
ncbi:acyl-CoA dehydrogenase family protein [Ottowia sp.]|uniref:acyl-CoA dehydrogenase family protein n=1 Tax=Ottowia sp. TaxID=1898956 RepID=UPI0025ED9C57|nr:acyl-CoA dehydrogenase family protein [Ottowia sp.]